MKSPGSLFHYDPIIFIFFVFIYERSEKISINSSYSLVLAWILFSKFIFRKIINLTVSWLCMWKGKMQKQRYFSILLVPEFLLFHSLFFERSLIHYWTEIFFLTPSIAKRFDICLSTYINQSIWNLSEFYCRTIPHVDIKIHSKVCIWMAHVAH
jgi:hypothetical protein